LQIVNFGREIGKKDSGRHLMLDKTRPLLYAASFIDGKFPASQSSNSHCRAAGPVVENY